MNSKPIRILHIVGIMNMGGLENFLMNVYRNIDRNKIQFDFLVTREEKGIFDEEIKELGGNIYNIPKMETVGYNKYSKILYDFFKNHSEYKIVHCHRDALCAVYLKQARKSNIPIRIAHSHSSKILEKKNIKGLFKTIIKNYFKTRIKLYATHFFACSYNAGKWLFGNNVSDNNMIIIKNGIELYKYEYNESTRIRIRKSLKLDKDIFLIGHVGRFDTPKNHKFLIDTIKEMDKYIVDYKVLLVGDGPLRKDMEDLVKKYNLQEKILFLGIRNNVNELMMAFDLFLFPSLFEGLPLVLIEAQSTGLKCVISDNISEEVDMNVDLIEKNNIYDIDIWIESVKKVYLNIDFDRKQRHLVYNKLKDSKYNVFYVSKYLTKFYIEKYKY